MERANTYMIIQRRHFWSKGLSEKKSEKYRKIKSEINCPLSLSSAVYLLVLLNLNVSEANSVDPDQTACTSRSNLICVHTDFMPKLVLEISIYTSLQIRMRIGKLFLYFSSKTYVEGTQKNRLNETVLLSTQNTCLN